MSALRREARRSSGISTWLDHAFCTAPADRATAEHAITGLYALLNQPPPEFVWVPSPRAAVPFLPPPQALSMGRPLPFEARLASRVAALRTHRSDVPPGLRRTVKESVAAVIRAAIPHPFGLHWYGHQEAYWVPPDSGDPELELWADLVRSCGWWWPRAGVCVVSERPSTIRTELVGREARRLHSETGPAVTYRDGWNLYAWHGVQVPSWVIEAPDTARINKEFDTDVWRSAIERLGWPAYIEQAGLRMLGRATDPGNPGGELQLYTLPREKGSAPTRLLLAVDGSRRHGLRVPAKFDDPLDAASWSYGLSGAQYARLQRRA